MVILVKQLYMQCLGALQIEIKEGKQPGKRCAKDKTKSKSASKVCTLKEVCLGEYLCIKSIWQNKSLLLGLSFGFRMRITS